MFAKLNKTGELTKILSVKSFFLQTNVVFFKIIYV